MSIEMSIDFEVAHDGSAYDAGFDPGEPRDYHGRWSKISFNANEWAALGMSAAREKWKILSREEKDRYGDARNSITQRLNELVDYRLPVTSVNLIDSFMSNFHRSLTNAVGNSPQVEELTAFARNAIVAQETEAMGRSLGDHGIHHLIQDCSLATKILNSMPGHVGTVYNRALINIATVFHDIGYLAPPSRVFLDADHSRWSAQYYQEHVAPIVSQIFDKNFSDMVATVIYTHDHTQLDWENEPEISAFSTADNLALFHFEKMPPLLRHVPLTTQILVDLGREKITVAEAHQKMHEAVNASDLSDEMKTQANHAVDEVSGILPKFTLGMVGAKIENVHWNVDHPDIVIGRYEANESLCKVTDLGYEQFRKLAKTYNQNPDTFLSSHHLELKSDQGKTVLEFDIVDRLKTNDAGFDPNEPRDWHGKWTRIGYHSKIQPKPIDYPIEHKASELEHSLIDREVSKLAHHVHLSTIDEMPDEINRFVRREYSASDVGLIRDFTILKALNDAFDDCEKFAPKSFKYMNFVFANYDSKFTISMSTLNPTHLTSSMWGEKAAEYAGWIFNNGSVERTKKFVKEGLATNVSGIFATKKFTEDVANGIGLEQAERNLVYNYYKSVMHHEFAHWLDHAWGDELSKQYKRFILEVSNAVVPSEMSHTNEGSSSYWGGQFWLDEMKLVLFCQDNISPYGGSNPAECFAESFARWLDDPNFNPTLKEWFERNIVIHNESHSMYAARDSLTIIPKTRTQIEHHPDPKDFDKDGNVIVDLEAWREGPDFEIAKDGSIYSTKDNDNVDDMGSTHGAGMALIDPDGNILFVRRDGKGDYPQTWAIPGGKINPGESAEQAAEREAIEEVGYVSNGAYPMTFHTNDPVSFKTFVKPVEHQFSPQWLQEHSTYEWRPWNDPPRPLHPGVQQLLYKMHGVVVDSEQFVSVSIPLLIRLMEYAREDAKDDEALHFVAENAINAGGKLTMSDYEELVKRGIIDSGFDPNEPRDAHGRWTKGGAKKSIENEPELPFELPEEDDWKINNLDEQDVDPFVEENVRAIINDDFPNMKNYEVCGPPDHGYNCIAWAFGFNDRWWNPRKFGNVDSYDEMLSDYGAKVYDYDSYRHLVDEKPEHGTVKLALWGYGERPEHMTRQLPDGRWTSKFGGNGKTVQSDLHEMEGGIYGDIKSIYVMPIKEFSHFRKDHLNDKYS